MRTWTIIRLLFPVAAFGLLAYLNRQRIKRIEEEERRR